MGWQQHTIFALYYHEKLQPGLCKPTFNSTSTATLTSFSTSLTSFQSNCLWFKLPCARQGTEEWKLYSTRWQRTHTRSFEAQTEGKDEYLFWWRQLVFCITESRYFQCYLLRALKLTHDQAWVSMIMIKHDRHAAEIQSDVVQCNGSRRSRLTRAHHPC